MLLAGVPSSIVLNSKKKWLTYEYSSKEIGAKRKDGHVRLDKSPVKEANVFKKEEKLPC
jgi:hypothetical protein